MDRSVYLALSCLTFYLLWRLTRRTSDRKLPPGPKGLPLIGNLFQLSNDVWLRFSEWKQTYGPIIHLNIAGQSVIVVNSHEVATDLFDRRHQIYSDRPRNIVASEIMSGGIMIVFTPYGDLWRRMRRAAHEGLGKRAVATMNTIQTREALRLANDMLSDPAHWDEHCVR
ncbi:cytochrome P450 [Punctularia strigosozonata HHB-11173 SS5]|uniref:cytochrome P450 n=1 Tax=Punctularia strigosozonata (strain HHB-11173) TaxID=741275 RepID=UPI00044182D2|nr:cytochrome P450 [Punctularia strigosozonata HHB-11173 SS5]EIN11993.1 cytochrome P450 [Punctularia strigosozonata HHB-11173 SS5]